MYALNRMERGKPMETVVKQNMLTTLEKLPDEALEEMVTFVGYLQYKYRVQQPATPAPISQEQDHPWEAFIQLIRQVQQGPWATEQTAGEILSSMRR
jgi:hypothetical protein